ncbi:MAG: precorrin-6A reductase [Eubacterium sp.]|nr:precorrin-6A reductase [Eubacterium sp.]
MKKIIIFSGTTEGRTLSTLLTQRRIPHVVCVASAYGGEMMEDSTFAELHIGRMDAEEMKQFLSARISGAEGMVVDATHPYATEVTANIKLAAEAEGVPYLRVVRGASDAAPGDMAVYSDIRACAEAMDQTSGNILLTTGSKELRAYCAVVSEETRKRTYVRVLPTMSSLEQCISEGIEGDHIIAMHGPFTRECNEAILRQYDIRHLVTKDSGTAGGFLAKAEAAEAATVQLHVIARPVEEEGVSLKEAERVLLSLLSECQESGSIPEVSIVGIGMGSSGCRLLMAEEALHAADAVFGASRLLEGLKDIPEVRKYAMYRAEEIIPVLERECFNRVVILYSGDTGFYSGARKMLRALKEWKPDLQVEMFPGISSFSYLAAKLGESYEDAALFSLHGKNSEADFGALVGEVRHHPKVFALLSGPEDVPEIAKRLLAAGIEGSISVGTDLSGEGEQIDTYSLSEAESFRREGISTVLIRNSVPEKRVLLPVKRDTEFLRDRIPMTKECIRHESILRLELREGDVLYDIGGGTGSVAIEAAALSSSLKVYTIEKKPEAAALIRENLKNTGTENVTVIEGEAPAALSGLPKPDAVFIGGSGGNLLEILEILTAMGTGTRYVINAVSMETIGEIRELLKDYPAKDERTVMISVSDVREVGSHHLLQAQNPVWIFSFSI